jgi:hypothetical protein
MSAHAGTLACAGEHSIDSWRGRGELRTVKDASNSPLDEIALLVRQAKSGHRDAFDCLHARYAVMVHGLLMAHVPKQEVDDLVQDVFARAWLRIQDVKQDAAFGG